MIHRVIAGMLLPLIFCVGNAIAQAPKGPTPRERIVLGLIDTNGDGKISLEELETFLSAALLARASHIGLTIGADPAQFQRLVHLGSIKMLGGSSADGNQTIEGREIDLLEQQSLPPPFSGTVADLLPALASKPSGVAWTDTLAKWLRIRQSFLDDQSIGKPAAISLTNHSRDDETVEAGKPRREWKVDASAVLDGFYEWHHGDQWYVRPVVGYEAHITSDDPTSDQITHRVGVQIDDVAPSGTGAQTLRATFDYGTDRTYASAVFGSTAEYTFDAYALGIGRYIAHGAAIDFRWKPSFGITTGHVKSAGTVDAYKMLTNFAHEFVKLTGEVRLGPRGLLTPETTIWHGERTDANGVVSHWQVVGSLDNRWVLSESKGKERASFDLSLTLGRDSPTFKMAKSFEAAFAFKF
jgi:hypothetical protein